MSAAITVVELEVAEEVKDVEEVDERPLAWGIKEGHGAQKAWWEALVLSAAITVITLSTSLPLTPHNPFRASSPSSPSPPPSLSCLRA